MESNFMMRPTDVLVSYLAATTDLTEAAVKRLLRAGRIAMGMEVITVIRLLEDHQLMTEYEEMVSCLQTLLQDQDLAEDALTWYENLSEWRKPKLVQDSTQTSGRVGVVEVEDFSEMPSDVEAPRGEQPRLDSTDAQPGNGRNSDPPSAG